MGLIGIFGGVVVVAAEYYSMKWCGDGDEWFGIFYGIGLIAMGVRSLFGKKVCNQTEPFYTSDNNYNHTQEPVIHTITTTPVEDKNEYKTIYVKSYTKKIKK